jgi:hypothetical protein
MAGHHAEQGPTAPDIFAGATIPIRMELNIELRTGDPDSVRADPGSLAERLRGQEDLIMKWLRANKANRQQLLADPLGALEAIGIELSEEEWSALRRAHRAREAADVVPPGVTIESLNVAVARARRTKKGE